MLRSLAMVVSARAHGSLCTDDIDGATKCVVQLVHVGAPGLRQVGLQFKNRACEPLGFVTPGPYRIVRHPLYVGWLFAFWSTPSMTVTHLVFAAATTAYILIAIRLEERDLARALPQYDAYRARVPMLVPRLNKTRRWQEDPA